MVRALPLALLVAAPLAVAGCAERYKEPIAFEPHGAAVRHNMAAQIVDPTPSIAPPGPMDAERALLGLDRYRTDTVEALGDVSTAPTVVVAPTN
jgi:type IV pilus biogenesis protein CpaD/CtpE